MTSSSNDVGSPSCPPREENNDERSNCSKEGKTTHRLLVKEEPPPSRRSLCPRRPHGLRVSNPRLPPTTPIVGMGCSSFSSFFLRTSSGEDGEVKMENLRQDHPTVRSWIDAVRHAVLGRGVNLLDTAPWYGHGASETVIGWAMEDILLTEVEEDKAKDDEAQRTEVGAAVPEGKVRRSEIVINTKVGRYDADPSVQFDFSYDRVLSSVSMSLKRMKCQYIDVLQLHDPEFAPSVDLLLEETVPAMVRCRDKLHLCRALGVTGYPLEVQHEVLRRSATARGVVFDQALTYCHYNLHDTTLFDAPAKPKNEHEDGSTDSDAHDPSQSFADYCFSHSIGLQSAAPLSMGLLTPIGPPKWHPAPDELKFACRRATQLCVDWGVDLADLAILFALAERRIPCTLIGMKDKSEVDRATDAALRFAEIDGEKTAEEVLDSVLTHSEREALKAVRDSKNGPFAKIWEKGEHHWDGKGEADAFWDTVPGGREGAEERMRVRGKDDGGGYAIS